MIKFLQSLSFSDEEIGQVAQQFFGLEGKFNLEQLSVINCFSKENIQACPGSGKTTTLAAKLILLQKHLQSHTFGGICILTHTNVAVDIIKKRLGNEGTAFFSNYPNYLGTIQSFVNKFLAIPAFRQIYQSSVQAIDDDIYYAVIGRRQNRNAPNAVSYLIDRSRQIEHLGDLSYNIHNFDISLKAEVSNPIAQKHTNTYQEVETLKNLILSEGFLKFDEAYSLAFKHLREHPLIVPIFSKRFPMVFLDEMQDTENHQFALLNQIFENSIFQTIGDGNQDIFGNYEEIKTHWPTSTKYSIATSSRFPQHIANTVQKVAVQPQNLVGTISANPVPTHIIVFDDTTISLVKTKFGELIINYNLQDIPDCTFKAVGGRKNTGALNVRSYFDEFNKTVTKVREHYPTLDDYLNSLKLASEKSRNAREIKSILVLGILEMLKLLGIRDETRDRPFTSTSLERYLKETEEILFVQYRKIIAETIVSHASGGEIKQAVINFVSGHLMSHFKKVPTVDYKNFITFPAEITDPGAKIRQNICEIYHNDLRVDVIFDTVHAVKGETHTATLYLETFNRAFDIEKLLPLISGTQNPTRSYVNNNKKRMTQGYVAMSRPTHLLCLAVHQSRINLSVDWNSLGIQILNC